MNHDHPTDHIGIVQAARQRAGVWLNLVSEAQIADWWDADRNPSGWAARAADEIVDQPDPAVGRLPIWCCPAWRNAQVVALADHLNDWQARR